MPSNYLTKSVSNRIVERLLIRSSGGGEGRRGGGEDQWATLGQLIPFIWMPVQIEIISCLIFPLIGANRPSGDAHHLLSSSSSTHNGWRINHLENGSGSSRDYKSPSTSPE